MIINFLISNQNLLILHSHCKMLPPRSESWTQNQLKGLSLIRISFEKRHSNRKSEGVEPLIAPTKSLNQFHNSRLREDQVILKAAHSH